MFPASAANLLRPQELPGCERDSHPIQRGAIHICSNRWKLLGVFLTRTTKLSLASLGAGVEAEMSDTRVLSEQAAELARKLVAERLPAGADGLRILAEMEEALAEVKRGLGEQMQRLRIEQQKREALNRKGCASCGSAARFCGLRERLVVTRHGELRCTRRYYHCVRCQAGVAPLDGRLGLDGHETTPLVREWLADLGSDGTIETAVRRLETFTGLRLSESTAARITLEVGRLRAEELREAEDVLAGTALPRRTGWQPQRLYVSLDGTMVPLRDPVEARWEPRPAALSVWRMQDRSVFRDPSGSPRQTGGVAPPIHSYAGAGGDLRRAGGGFGLSLRE